MDMIKKAGAADLARGKGVFQRKAWEALHDRRREERDRRSRRARMRGHWPDDHRLRRVCRRRL